jgi:5'-methylthioadenosine phosphorylase
VISDQSSVIGHQSATLNTQLSTLNSAVTHTDFSEPYCPELRAGVEEAAAGLDIDLLPRGTYLCADGPRFETPAEIALFAQWGADVVGMTGLPEAVFAREAGLCYAAVAIVTNFAAGLTPHPVDHSEVVARVAQDAERVRGLLMAAAGRIPDDRGCKCAGSSS